jgi:prevent-host-death family protein
MKTVTALEAKNAFGQFLDAAQREPVLVTKNNRTVAALFSVHDIEQMANAYLSAAERDSLPAAATSADMIEALMRQAKADEKIALSRAEISQGKVIEMDTRYFDTLRQRVMVSTKI